MTWTHADCTLLRFQYFVIKTRTWLGPQFLLEWHINAGAQFSLDPHIAAGRPLSMDPSIAWSTISSRPTHTFNLYAGPHFSLDPHTLLQVYNCFWTPQYSPDPNIAAGPQFLLVHNHFWVHTLLRVHNFLWNLILLQDLCHLKWPLIHKGFVSPKVTTYSLRNSVAYSDHLFI